MVNNEKQVAWSRMVFGGEWIGGARRLIGDEFLTV